MTSLRLSSATETMAYGHSLAGHLTSGDLVLLVGELGAGKTTLVRGILGALGHQLPVKSPTYNLIQVYPTVPAVMHADLYRLQEGHFDDLDDYLQDHLCLVEWPDRDKQLFDLATHIVSIEFEGDARRISISRQ